MKRQLTEQGELDLAESKADRAEAYREIDADYHNRPGRDGWAPADFEYECPAARRGP